MDTEALSPQRTALGRLREVILVSSQPQSSVSLPEYLNSNQKMSKISVAVPDPWQRFSAIYVVAVNLRSIDLRKSTTRSPKPRQS